MSQGEGKSERTGLPESLRTAVERTIEATTGTAAMSAEQINSMLGAKRDRGVLAGRARELLDEVARRGERTREGLAGIRFASAREVAELNERLERIERRLAELEAQSKSRPEG